MTFFGGTIACAHCIVNAFCTQKKNPKAHYKCISVTVHVVKFQPKNKTTNYFFEEVALSTSQKYWMFMRPLVVLYSRFQTTS